MQNKRYFCFILFFRKTINYDIRATRLSGEWNESITMGQVICCQFLGKTVTVNGVTYSVEKTIGEGGLSLSNCNYNFFVILHLIQNIVAENCLKKFYHNY